MIETHGFLGVFRSELISSRRIIRTRILVVVNALLIVPFFVLFTLTNGAESAYLPSAGVLSPQYSLPFFGAWALLISFIGIIFLSFDVLQKDRRARIEEVLYSKRLNNIELVLGRAVAFAILMWVPILVIFIACNVVGYVLELNQRVMYGTFEPFSLSGWLFITAPVALFTWSAVLALVASACRIRLVIFMVGILVLFVEFLIGAFTPLVYSTYTTFGLNAAYFPSTFTPTIMTSGELLHRISLLLIAGGAVLLAATLHPRRDHLNKLAVSTVALVLMTLGVGNSSLQILDSLNKQKQIQRWAQIHSDINSLNEIDIGHIEGKVSIFPGERMDLSVEIHMQATDTYKGGNLLFNFNPGLYIQTLVIDQDPDATYRFEDGLISVVPSTELPTGARLILRLDATGVPDPSFSYLHASKDMGKAVGMDGSLAAFGINSSLFQSDYVALMSGVRWLPQAGPYTSSWADPDRPVDFFTIDLAVELPKNWLVAGPGTRKSGPIQDERQVFEFSPNVRVPRVTLLAAEFTRYSLEKRGLEFELLIDDYHERSIAYFEDSMNDIHDEIDRILDVADTAGISYPLDSLSFVEVPIHLRTIGGGWRMDSEQAQPGIVMLREHHFLKANFQYIRQFQEILTQVGYESLENRGSDLPHKVRQIREYFNNDLNGGNALDGIARNALFLRTHPIGAPAPALAQLNHALMSEILFDGVGHFSPFALSYAKDYDFLLLPPVLSRTYEELTISTYGLFSRTSVITPKLNREDTHPSILTMISEMSLIDLSYDADVETTFDFIDRKAYSKAASLLDEVGSEQIGLYLGNLLDVSDGENVQLEDVEYVTAKTGIDTATNIRDWISTSSLPGFLVSAPKILRIKDSEIGFPQYQLSFHVRNDEPTPGSLSVHLVNRTRAEVGIASHRLAGNKSIKFNFLSDEPATMVFIRPYLSLNQQRIFLNTRDIKIEHLEHLEASPKIEESTWRAEPSKYIVVDDLDEGFSVVNLPKPKRNVFTWLRARNTQPLRLDYGLPEFTYTFRLFAPEFNQWVRRADMVSWGKYRRTSAVYMQDAPNLKAKFEVTLPETGKWQLDYHLAKGYRTQWGTSPNKYPLEIISGSETFTAELAIRDSLNLWSRVGSFDLPSQEVAVVVTTENNANGRSYYTAADAIRWSKVEEHAK